jgi:hypothetical protein
MRIPLAILFLALLLPAILFAEPENYCLDQNSWAEWDELVANNPNDMEIHTLHALRIGLCVKVGRDGITLDQATEIFESARETIIEKRQDDVNRNPDRQKL